MTVKSSVCFILSLFFVGFLGFLCGASCTTKKAGKKKKKVKSGYIMSTSNGEYDVRPLSGED